MGKIGALEGACVKTESYSAPLRPQIQLRAREDIWSLGGNRNFVCRLPPPVTVEISDKFTLSMQSFYKLRYFGL